MIRPLDRLLLLAPLAATTCKPAAAPLAPPPSTPVPVAADPAPTAVNEREVELPPAPVVYGQFRVPAPDKLLQQVREQLVPPGQRPMLNDQMLRSMLGMALGPRSELAQKVDLTRPMGCVVTSPKRHDMPLACTVAYQGGFDQLMRDLGPEGYISGGAAHAHYRLDARPVYFNAMGEHVAFAFAPDLTAATRERLERDIIAAPAGPRDLEATAFLAAIFEDARDEVEELAAQMGSTPSSRYVTEAYTEAQREAQRQQWLSYGDLEQAEVWLDLSPDRVRVGYRGTAREGTATHAAYEGQRQRRHDPALLAMLPAEAVVLGTMNFDLAAMNADPMLGTQLRTLGAMDSSGASAAFAEAVRDGMAIWTEVATGSSAMAVIHQRDTVGGLVMLNRLEPGKDARARLQEVFERYQSLSPQAPLSFDFTLKEGAVRAGKVRGDVLTIRPNAEAEQTLQHDPGWIALARKLGGPPQLQIAYAQKGDVLTMVMAPQKAGRYLQRALAAGAGRKNVGGRKEVLPVFEAHPEGSIVFAFDVGEVIDWLVTIDAIDPPPAALGGQVDDVVAWMRPGESGQREVVFDVSQDLIDSLLALGG